MPNLRAVRPLRSRFRGSDPGSRSRPSTPRTVLVTGGTGFIGSVLVAHLRDAGHRVTAVDCGSEPRHLRARESLAGVRLVDADLTRVDLPSLLDGIDLVVHLAGRAGVQTSWGDGFDDHLRHNVALTDRVLEAARVARVGRVVVASSSSVYGNVESGFATEDLPPGPLSPYGVSKVAVEQLVGVYAARGVPAVALRYFSVYGRGQRPDMALARMIAAAQGGPPFVLRGDGTATRDLTHVDDVARATTAALFAPLEPGTICNVGTGRPISVSAMLTTVTEVVGTPVPVVGAPALPGDPARTAADRRRAAARLGWRPRVPFTDGVRDQVAAFPVGPPVALAHERSA